MEIFRPSGQAILTVRRLLHNLLTAQFSEEGSNRRIFENATYEQFVKYVREVASKTFSKFQIFSWNMRYLIATAEFKVKLTIVDASQQTMQTQISNFCLSKYNSGKYKSNMILIFKALHGLKPWNIEIYVKIYALFCLTIGRNYATIQNKELFDMIC